MATTLKKIGKFLCSMRFAMVLLVILGGILIYLAANRNARETMERKFFL